MMLYRQFATQEEIDKEYDAEKLVPDFQPYAEYYINESKKARDELECFLDVPFGPTVEETLDIFPAQDPDAPILVFIHGGYWRSLSSKEFSLVARGPVALGFTVVNTNYALCPKVTLPEITRQNRAAIAWVQRSSQGRSTGRLVQLRGPFEVATGVTRLRTVLCTAAVTAVEPFAIASAWIAAVQTKTTHARRASNA